jgi:hypothetical protein
VTGRPNYIAASDRLKAKFLAFVDIHTFMWTLDAQICGLMLLMVCGMAASHKVSPEV